MPPKTVNSDTFNALHIAQASINYVHNALTYGANNQVADLTKQYGPDGVTPTNGETIPRLAAVRTAVPKIIAAPHLAMPTMPDNFFGVGVTAGVSAFYRAG